MDLATLVIEVTNFELYGLGTLTKYTIHVSCSVTAKTVNNIEIFCGV